MSAYSCLGKFAFIMNGWPQPAFSYSLHTGKRTWMTLKSNHLVKHKLIRCWFNSKSKRCQTEENSEKRSEKWKGPSSSKNGVNSTCYEHRTTWHSQQTIAQILGKTQNTPVLKVGGLKTIPPSPTEILEKLCIMDDSRRSHVTSDPSSCKLVLNSIIAF